jgi:hypothetical protein
MNPAEAVQNNQFLEVVVGILGLVVIILIHGAGIRFVNLRFSQAWAGVSDRTPRFRTDLMLARVIASLATLHLAETLLISLPIWAAGIIPTLRDSYFFVLECYTTLGAGDVTIPDQWRLFGPIIAIGGLFTFGWTGSVLVGIMGNLNSFDRERSEKAHRKDG